MKERECLRIYINVKLRAHVDKGLRIELACLHKLAQAGAT